MKRILLCVLLCILAVSCEKTRLPEEKPKPDSEVIETEKYSLKIDRTANTAEIISPPELAGVKAELTDTGAYLISGEIRLPLDEKTAEIWRGYLR